MDHNAKSLYICYFGLNEPLVQTQVLPYLREIRKSGYDLSLLTFEPKRRDWPSESIENAARKLADEGITWHCLTYHKRPSLPATLYDVICGSVFIWYLIRRDGIDILHARVHVPALMSAIAKQLSFGRNPKLLFDIRGFFPEEYTDAGVWKDGGVLYRMTKMVEKWLLKVSDGFVVLTEKAREILFPESKDTGFDSSGRPVEVIPCCVDFERFSPRNGNSTEIPQTRLKLSDRFVVAYVGSFGGWYLTEDMIDFFETSRKLNPSTFALILTQRNKEEIINKLKQRGFKDKDFLVDSVAPTRVAEYLRDADLAISFIKACYSKQSSSPTKIAEYLASGIPIVTNRGVGDVVEQIEADAVGLVVSDLSPKSYEQVLGEIEELRKNTDLALRCRNSAKKRFDLKKVGGVLYTRIYRRLNGG